MFSWQGTFTCMPAVALLLLAGLLTGHTGVGVITAAGAFSVGFGSFQEIRSRRVLPMIAASLGICVSSWIGTFSGVDPVLSTCVVTIAGAIYAAISFCSPGITWVILQCLIWLVISTAYPAHGGHIPVRGSLLLVGGLLQTIFVTSVWKLRHAEGPVYAQSSGREAGPVENVRAALVAGSPQAWYAIRASLTLCLAMILYRVAGFPNAYWIPMTVVLVLKPDRQQQLARALQRMLGTILGAAAASWINLLLSRTRERPIELAVLVLIFGGASYALLFVNYAIFSMCLTSYVIFLLALAGLSEKAVILHRVLATVVGSALVLASDTVRSALMRASARDH